MEELESQNSALDNYYIDDEAVLNNQINVQRVMFVKIFLFFGFGNVTDRLLNVPYMQAGGQR